MARRIPGVGTPQTQSGDRDLQGLAPGLTTNGGMGSGGPQIAPAPQYPERAPTVYERVMAPARPMQKGPLRFEEGIATDTDVPNDFIAEMQRDAQGAPGRPNHVNPETQYKHADQTMAERAHVGSASWIEAPTFLGEFAHGTMTGYSEVVYEQVDRSGGRYERHNPASIG